ncbi:MAG: hypothetical protein A2020_00825 [Lentisphaerae bacterium GWF2_45_14]|nr:MAG: hypothetical protein A2020_00825 [Lentisphaerae bacterium GWF2_45_14]
MKKTIFLLVLFVGGGNILFADENKFLKEYLEVIKSHNARGIILKIESFDKNSPDLSSDLVKLIETEKDSYKKAMLIYLAGRLKLENFMPVLISNLDFVYRDPDANSLRMPRWSVFPAVDALSSIGTKSVQALAKETAERSHNYPDILLLLSIRQIRQTYIKNVKSVLPTKLILEANYRKEEDSKRKGNLKRAIDLISQPDYLEQENKYMRSEINKAQEKVKVPEDS